MSSGQKIKTVVIDPTPCVHHLIAWAFAYNEARKSKWIEMTVDRERFKRRILQFEKDFERVLIERQKRIIDLKNNESSVFSKPLMSKEVMSLTRGRVLLLDYQYHATNENEIFLKELVFMRADSIIPEIYYFKPPYEWNMLNRESKKRIRFCEKFINKIPWSSGRSSYLELSFILKRLNNDDSIDVILVKGEDRVKFLLPYLHKVKEIQMPNSFKNYPSHHHQCKVHDSDFHRCSINHVFQMLMYLTNKNLLL